MTDFFAALGLLLVIEGVVYAAAPNAVRRAAAVLRGGGLVAAFLGVAIVWIVRG